MSFFFISTKIQEFIAVADQTLIGVFEQCFHLCNVLDDDTAGDPSGTHRSQYLVKVIRQGYVWPFIHNAVYRNREPSSVLPVCHIIQCLKQITVDHADEIIHTGICIRDTAK